MSSERPTGFRPLDRIGYHTTLAEFLILIQRNHRAATHPALQKACRWQQAAEIFIGVRAMQAGRPCIPARPSRSSAPPPGCQKRSQHDRSARAAVYCAQILQPATRAHCQPQRPEPPPRLLYIHRVAGLHSASAREVALRSRAGALARVPRSGPSETNPRQQS
jgi:hypothetical protein